MSTIFGDTTVVTEVRTYQVDKRGRKGVGRAAVSARSDNISTQTVNVSRTQSHTIAKHPNKHLTIRTDFPVLAKFIQGTPEPEYPTPQPVQFTTAVIYAEDFVLNSDNQIALYEPDSDAPSQKVTVFNATTGETEIVELELVSPGMYLGYLRVKAQTQIGTNFDGCLYADYGHNIKIHFKDSRTAAGVPATVIKSIGVLRADTHPELIVRPFAAVHSMIGVMMRGRVVNHAVVNVVNRRTNYSLQIPLAAQQGGMYGSFPASDLQGGLEVDDIIETTYSWFDVYNVQQQVTSITKIVQTYPQGVLHVPQTVKHNTPVIIRVSDAELVGTSVGVVAVDLDTEAFVRIRLERVGEHTGLYEAAWMPPAEYRNVEIRYTDGSVVTKALTVLEPEVPSDGDDTDPGTPPQQVEIVSELEMVINGLFVLNGRFSGTITLSAYDRETASCTITHAS